MKEDESTSKAIIAFGLWLFHIIPLFLIVEGVETDKLVFISSLFVLSIVFLLTGWHRIKGKAQHQKKLERLLEQHQANLAAADAELAQISETYRSAALLCRTRVRIAEIAVNNTRDELATLEAEATAEEADVARRATPAQTFES